MGGRSSRSGGAGVDTDAAGAAAGVEKNKGFPEPATAILFCLSVVRSVCRCPLVRASMPLVFAAACRVWA